jgi:hypothetical protein
MFENRSTAVWTMNATTFTTNNAIVIDHGPLNAGRRI